MAKGTHHSIHPAEAALTDGVRFRADGGASGATMLGGERTYEIGQRLAGVRVMFR